MTIQRLQSIYINGYMWCKCCVNSAERRCFFIVRMLYAPHPHKNPIAPYNQINIGWDHVPTRKERKSYGYYNRKQEA